MSVNLVTASNHSSKQAPCRPTTPGCQIRCGKQEQQPGHEVEQQRDVDET